MLFRWTNSFYGSFLKLIFLEKLQQGGQRAIYHYVLLLKAELDFREEKIICFTASDRCEKENGTPLHQELRFIIKIP